MSAAATPHTSDGQEKVKRTRASTSRVRTGCKTCKIRHLKCDEEKPVCRRCMQGRRKCDGYDPPNQPPRTRQRKAPLPLMPRNHPLETSTQLRSISAAISGTQVEKFFFYHARDCTIKDLGGSSSILEKFWCNYVLPLGHNVDSIKHALIALGAAHLSFLRPHSPNLGMSDYQNYDKISIQQYNRAIQQVTSVMSDPSPVNIQVTLVCCLIFVCIENLRGQYGEALRHLRAGSRLLDLRYHSATTLPAGASKQATASSIFTGTSSEFDQLCDIADMFSRLGLDAAILVDDQVVSASGVTFFSRPIDEEDSLRPFPSIETADKQLRLLERDFNSMWEFEEQLWNSVCHDDSGATRCEDWSLAEGWACVENGLAYQALYDRFDKWVSRFNLYMDGLLKRPVSAQELRQAMVLVLHRKVWSAMFKMGPCAENKLERKDFEHIVEQAELLAESSPSPTHPMFIFDAEFIPCLTFICCFCEHADLRRRAISLLRSMNRREGIWDSREMAEVFEATFMVGEHNLALDEWEQGDILKLVRVLSGLGLLKANTTSAVTLLARSKEYQCTSAKM